MADDTELNVMAGGDTIATTEQDSHKVPNEMGATHKQTAVIANGAAVSDAQDLKGSRYISLQMPAAWTAANLTFQGSNDNSTFNDIYDSAGNELTATAAASRCITDIPELTPFRYIKIRSGTNGTPVNQGAERSIVIILKS